MLRRIDSPVTVLALEAVGKLGKEDYDTVLRPGIEALLQEWGEIRCVLVFGDEYEGVTVGGTAADAQLYVGEIVHGELSKWKRCAIVSGQDWLRHVVALFRWMMPGEVECFDPGDVQKAIAWAAG